MAPEGAKERAPGQRNAVINRQRETVLMGRGVGADVLRAEGITKGFTGAPALDDVDFEVRAGEVHVLLGENGAGKSTLVKVLAGVYPPDAGTATINGVPVRLPSPQRARELGIAAIYQEPAVVLSCPYRRTCSSLASHAASD